MTEAKHACPDCGSIDLIVQGQGVVGPGGESLATAACPNCSWQGSLRDTIGFATTETIWSTERIADVMLRVCTRHASGPLVQALEFIGLIPQMKKLPLHDEHADASQVPDINKHNELAQIIRDRVMKKTFEAMITTAFSEAAMCNKLYALEMDVPEHQVLRNKPSSVVDPGRTFGGDVVNIEDMRKKKEAEDGNP